MMIARWFPTVFSQILLRLFSFSFSFSSVIVPSFLSFNLLFHMRVYDIHNGTCANQRRLRLKNVANFGLFKLLLLFVFRIKERTETGGGRKKRKIIFCMKRDTKKSGMKEERRCSVPGAVVGTLRQSKGEAALRRQRVQLTNEQTYRFREAIVTNPTSRNAYEFHYVQCKRKHELMHKCINRRPKGFFSVCTIHHRYSVLRLLVLAVLIVVANMHNMRSNQKTFPFAHLKWIDFLHQ